MSNTPTYPHSTHVFMCPLRWDYLPTGYQPNQGKESLSFDTRTDMQQMLQFLKGTPWQRSFYRINNNPLQYNELTYFHAYTIRTLFDLQQPDERDEWMLSAKKVMAYFEIESTPTDTYTIETVADGTYELQLTGLGLHVYTTGIAILSINVDNYQYPKPEQVLRISEFGRRIYPQFLGDNEPFTTVTRSKVLAKTITLRCGNVQHGLPIVEDFSQYDTLVGKETHRFDMATNVYTRSQVLNFPQHIRQLFDDDFAFDSAAEADGNKIRFNLLTDDRMFFLSWYGNNDLTAILKQPNQLYNGDESFTYAQSSFWYAYLFGDKSADSLGIGNKFMQEKDLLEKTYARWAEYGTLYGFTRDSFVVISDPLDNMIRFAGINIRQHIKTIYYQMAVLCLAQRAGILRFSAESSSLAQLSKSNNAIVPDRIQHLYLNYLEFANAVCFREITPQIQGIDIYTQFRTAMNIPDTVKTLDEEIKELHDYAMLIAQNRAADKAEKLSNIATWFLPSGVLFGFIGMAAIDNDHLFFGGTPNLNIWKWIILVAVISALISWFILKGRTIFKSSKK